MGVSFFCCFALTNSDNLLCSLIHSKTSTLKSPLSLLSSLFSSFFPLSRDKFSFTQHLVSDGGFSPIPFRDCQANSLQSGRHVRLDHGSWAPQRRPFVRECLFSLIHLCHSFSQYDLQLRQQPKRSRMCGVGEKGLCLSRCLMTLVNNNNNTLTHYFFSIQLIGDPLILHVIPLMHINIDVYTHANIFYSYCATQG